jgi:NADH dehydrogenase
MSTRVVVLGGGFGGIYTTIGLDKAAKDLDLDVTLINRDNFFLFTPMLSEIATGGVDTRHSVNPIRRMFKRTRFIEGEIERIDFTSRCVAVQLPSDEVTEIPYDHLVFALGSVPNYFNIPGVEEHSISLKTLADAIVVRNQVIQRLEVADVCEPSKRAGLLTFVVAGGGLAGIELAGDLNDYIRGAARSYPNVSPFDIRVIILEAGPRLMAELSSSLAEFARRKLIERGVDVRVNTPVERATETAVTAGGVEIPTSNLYWTAGIAPTPFVEHLGIPLERGRIPTDQAMRVEGLPNVWALGDIARIPDGNGGFYPATAQHAVREGNRLALNIVRVLKGLEPKPFHYRTMGMLATVGHNVGVAESFGIKISGFPAWFMWRSYYLMRLPRVEKRLRVLIDWTLDLFFPRDIVQLKVVPADDVPRGESYPPKG